MPSARARLTQQDWIATGLSALERTGPSALAAEPLARALGTTKGSFYWHFKDVPAFRQAVMAAWQTRAMATLEGVDPDLGHTERLVALSRPDAAETAMRAAARADEVAESAVGAVDTARHAALAATLADLGLTNPEFARIVQAAVIGLETLGDTAPLSTLLAAILALQEA